MHPIKSSISLFLALAVFAVSRSPSFADETTGLNPIGGIGKHQKVLDSGEEAVLYQHEGKGCLSHFWFGGNFKGMGHTRIRYYVDEW